MTDDILTEGLDRWQVVAETLNSIIEQDGAIDINNPRIWNTILHTWSNEDWAVTIAVIGMYYEQQSGMFKSFHKDAYVSGLNTLKKYMDVHDRVLDKRAHKKTAWKLIMTMRELWNSAGGIYLPNDRNSKKLNEFHSMFE